MSKILNIDSKNGKREVEKKDFIKDLQQLEKYRQKESEKKPTVVIEFSWKLVLLAILTLLIIFLGPQILTVFIFLFIGFVFMSAARPVVTFLMDKKLSKGLSVSLTYLLGILLIAAVVAVVVIPFINQIDGLVRSVPIWTEKLIANIKDFSILGYSFDSSSVNKFITDGLQKITLTGSFKNIASTVGSVFSFTAILFASIIFSIYLVLDHDNILELGLVRITSDIKRKRVKELILEVEHKLGRWLLGQALVSSIAGITMGTVLSIMGIPFALPMGVFIALMSAIPNLGATISALPPLFIALVVKGPIAAVIILAIFLVYQQFENNFVAPKVMGNVMGLKPIFVMFAAAVFFILFGVWGAVLAVPAVVILRICYEFYIDLQKLKAKGSI